MRDAPSGWSGGGGRRNRPRSTRSAPDDRPADPAALQGPADPLDAEGPAGIATTLRDAPETHPAAVREIVG